MKQSYKPLIAVLLFLLISATTIILISVGIRLKYEDLTRQKMELEKQLKSGNTIKIKLLADQQMYTDENLIENFAIENLGMIKRNYKSLQLKINQDEVDKITYELKKKYE